MAPTEHEAAIVWSPCGHCWGQGRLYEPADAEGRAEPDMLVAVTCPACIGVGQTARPPDPADPPRLRPPARRAPVAVSVRWWAARALSAPDPPTPL